MNELFLNFLIKSDSLRSAYTSGLGTPDADWRSRYLSFITEIPVLLTAIYNNVKGTPYSIQDQSLMDFIPGYLLIAVNEYEKNYNDLKRLLNEEDTNIYFPILRSYSSDFIYLNTKSGGVYHFFMMMKLTSYMIVR